MDNVSSTIFNGCLGVADVKEYQVVRNYIHGVAKRKLTASSAFNVLDHT